jgi:ribosomal protein S18 acetylase RimI-like enzyme
MRRLASTELGQIESIARQCFEETKQPDESLDFEHFCWATRPALENGSLVLFVDGEPIRGFLLANFVPGLFGGKMTAYAVSWFVKPEFRERGLGSRFLDEFVAEGTRQQCRHFYFGHSATVNPDANFKFFEKRGFKWVENQYRKTVN